jgi:Fur family ferric uptake transcriptional regulator
MDRPPERGTDEHLAALRARGERLTPQRLMVLAAMHEAQGHHTAEAIYERVRERYPYVNLATIYRALGWLKEQGLVSETDLGGGQIEYEYLGTARHHHMVCLHCGGKAEFGDEVVVPLARALREQYGFAPRIDHLAIFGTCRYCQEVAAREQQAQTTSG